MKYRYVTRRVVSSLDLPAELARYAGDVWRLHTCILCPEEGFLLIFESQIETTGAANEVLPPRHPQTHLNP